MSYLFQTIILGIHVSFRECIGEIPFLGYIWILREQTNVFLKELFPSTSLQEDHSQLVVHVEFVDVAWQSGDILMLKDSSVFLGKMLVHVGMLSLLM